MTRWVALALRFSIWRQTKAKLVPVSRFKHKLLPDARSHWKRASWSLSNSVSVIVTVSYKEKSTKKTKENELDISFLGRWCWGGRLSLVFLFGLAFLWIRVCRFGCKLVVLGIGGYWPFEMLSVIFCVKNVRIKERACSNGGRVRSRTRELFVKTFLMEERQGTSKEANKSATISQFKLNILDGCIIEHGSLCLNRLPSLSLGFLQFWLSQQQHGNKTKEREGQRRKEGGRIMTKHLRLNSKRIVRQFPPSLWPLLRQRKETNLIVKQSTHTTLK